MSDDRINEILEARDRVKDYEEVETSFDWSTIPWYYRIALFISNHLLIASTLVFLAGIAVGMNV